MTMTTPAGPEAGDPWDDAVQTLADRVVKLADRFADSSPPEPRLRPVLIRQALMRAEDMVACRLAEGRVSRPDRLAPI